VVVELLCLPVCAANAGNGVPEVPKVPKVVERSVPVVEAFFVDASAGKDFVAATAALLGVRLLEVSLSPPSGISFNSAKTCINAFNL
jgi:hypothetical protein